MNNAPIRFLAAIDAILTGTVQPLSFHGVSIHTAIDKTMRQGKVRVHFDGAEGDDQGDKQHHGGRDKALHHYPFDHYAYWRKLLPDHPILIRVGAFGENISTVGITEEHLCIGDIVRVGSVLLQVSQGRQPCRTLNMRFRHPTMARDVQNCGRTGWYYRVLEEGDICVGDALTLVERPHPQWTLARVLSVIETRSLDKEILLALTALPELATSWKKLFASRLENNEVEDWHKRLGE